MFCRIVLLVGGLASLSTVSLSAQEAILGQKYGYGVHAYFSGDYLKTYEQLTAAIAGGSKDPRAFYFRGLAYLKLGREPEAKQDFQKGAALESRDVNEFYNVSKALERVQGQSRVELENYRVEARMAAMEETEKLRKARYEAIQREESRVLREEPPAPPESIAAPEPAAEKAAAEPVAADPFAAPAEKSALKAGKKPAKAGKNTATESAAGEKKPAEAPAGDDPFAAPAATPAEKTDAAKPAAGKKGGLLGAMGKAVGKAIGGDGEKTPAKEEKPAAEEKPADAANPFGEAPAAEKKKPAAEEKPAAEKKDSAAEEKPAEKKAADDPFK